MVRNQRKVDYLCGYEDSPVYVLEYVEQVSTRLIRLANYEEGWEGRPGNFNRSVNIYNNRLATRN